VEAGDPVVVVLDGGEAELGHDLRVRGVDAAHLVDGHLPLFEFGGFLVFGEGAQEQLAADLFLVGESGGVDGGEAEEEALFAGQAVVEGLDGVVGDLVVVALVAERGGKLRVVAEVVLPVVLEEGVEVLAAVFERRGGRGWARRAGDGAKRRSAETARRKVFNGGPRDGLRPWDEFRTTAGRQGPRD